MFAYHHFCTCFVMTCHSMFHLEVHRLQAKEALQSAYFDDLDKETVDALENDSIRAREG